jgi:hypothetical protein
MGSVSDRRRIGWRGRGDCNGVNIYNTYLLLKIFNLIFDKANAIKMLTMLFKEIRKSKYQLH